MIMPIDLFKTVCHAQPPSLLTFEKEKNGYVIGYRTRNIITGKSVKPKEFLCCPCLFDRLLTIRCRAQ